MFGLIVSATIVIVVLSFMAGLNYGLHFKKIKRKNKDIAGLIPSFYIVAIVFLKVTNYKKGGLVWLKKN